MLPQASAAAIARQPRMTGAFHGAIPSTTPTGSRSASESRPGLSEGMTSPVICVVSAAASRTIPAPSGNVEARPGLGRAELFLHGLDEPVRAGLEFGGGAIEEQAALGRTGGGP